MSSKDANEEKNWYHFTANGHGGLTLLTEARAAELGERYEVTPADEIPDTEAIIVPILRLLNKQNLRRG